MRESEKEETSRALLCLKDILPILELDMFYCFFFRFVLFCSRRLNYNLLLTNVLCFLCLSGPSTSASSH